MINEATQQHPGVRRRCKSAADLRRCCLEGTEGLLRADRGQLLGLCQEASEAVDDAYCREKLRVVGEFAAEMLSHSEHGRWGRDSMSGAEFLRQQVLNALELFASRLYSIEALEHRGATGGSPWKIRSNFAQT